MLVSFSSDICLWYPSWIKFFWQTSLSWMTTNTHVYMLGPSQGIQVIACLDINSIFGIRRIGSFQLLMFTVENYHTFCNALTAGTLQIAYGYPLVIIWLLGHITNWSIKGSITWAGPTKCPWQEKVCTWWTFDMARVAKFPTNENGRVLQMVCRAI